MKYKLLLIFVIAVVIISTGCSVFDNDDKDKKPEPINKENIDPNTIKENGSKVFE